MHDFGRFIRDQRTAMGLSLREAARRVGLSHFRLGEIEAGLNHRTGKPTRPSWDQVERIAEAYELPVHPLLAQAGYNVGVASSLTPEEREILLLFGKLPPDRRLMAIAAMRVFGLEGISGAGVAETGEL